MVLMGEVGGIQPFLHPAEWPWVPASWELGDGVGRGTLGGRDTHMGVAVGGDSCMQGSVISLMKGTGGPGYIQVEECEGNTHMEVAVGGGPIWRGQGTHYEGNVWAGV